MNNTATAGRQYRLEAKVRGRWGLVGTTRASDYRTAFGKAMLLLTPDLYDKPIRLAPVAAGKRLR
jgi:hypothetical protein